jgi:sulfatase maturation enzyme AslB (radical SAM superfamily)
MSLANFKKIFPQEFIAQLTEFVINGNYGDFVTAQDGLAIVEYIRSINSKVSIRISTNASAKPNIWARLGELKTIVHFRLDGLKDTHHLYRQYTDYDLILANAKSFIAHGGSAIWSMIRFDHNQHQIKECRNLANALGFEKFDLVDAGRNTFPVFFQDQKLSHIVGNYQGSTKFDDLVNQSQFYKVDPSYTVRNDHTSKPINCHSIKYRQIYVTANGEVYPCCWLGFYPLNSYAEPSNIQLRPLISNNNALAVGLKTAINWFNKIEDTWTKESVAKGKIYGCNTTCGKDNG